MLLVPKLSAGDAAPVILLGVLSLQSVHAQQITSVDVKTLVSTMSYSKI